MQMLTIKLNSGVNQFGRLFFSVVFLCRLLR